MSTATLTLYKDSKLDNSKNYVVDSIDTFLATLTSVSVNIQYQRFELNKTVKIDLTQDYQTKGTTFNKYDYAKIVTTVDQATVTYYYFILRATQKAQSTIEFELRMDTLNTFAFSSSIANNAYTLSPKTLVHREHKDRLYYTNIFTLYSDSTNLSSWSTFMTNLKSGTFSSAPESAYLTIETTRLLYICSSLSSGNKIPYITGDGTVVIRNNDYYTSYECDTIYFNCTGTYMLLVLYKDGSKLTEIYLTSDVSAYIYVESDSEFPFQSFVWGTTSYTFGDLMTAIFYLFQGISYKNDYYLRDIDVYQEGIETYLFKKDEETLYDNDGENQWYVVYKSNSTPVASSSSTASKYVNPVYIQLFSDSGYTITTSSATEVSFYATDSRIPKWTQSYEILSFAVDNDTTATGEKYIIVNGTTYDFYTLYQTYGYMFISIQRTNNSDTTFAYVKGYYISNVSSGQTTTVFSDTTPFAYFQVYGINSVSVVGQWGNKSSINLKSGASGYSGECVPWREQDLTNEQWIKAFAFPYCPLEFLINASSFSYVPESMSLNVTDIALQVDYPQQATFSYQKTLDYTSPMSPLILESTDLDIGYAKERNVLYESKLYHSDFYRTKFVYDSFSFPFYLENVDEDNYFENYPNQDEFIFSYTVSRNIVSKFLFTFDTYVLKRSLQDYDNILLIDRNNEKALYTNAYINYIRSGGYNYDIKKAESQNAVNAVTTALSIVGSIASFASASATGGMGIAGGVGLAVKATTGIIRGIHTAQEQDRAISQKINQMQLEGSSVQGTEDIDLLTAFSNNKPKLAYYELSDIMKQAVWDLFHYCGYATHEQKVPDVTTRLYFNFVSADIVFDEYNFNEDIADDIRNKWKEGITFFHLVNGDYNFDQDYENFETSLL